MGRRLWSGAGLFFTLLFGAPSSAQDGAARLDFAAPESCPQLSDFSHEVESRLGRGRLARPGEMARTFHVRVRRLAEKSLAKLTFTDADGRIAEREVSAASCDEATRAIAIVTALAIDARAEEEAKASGSQGAVVTPPVATTLPPPPAPIPAPRRAPEESLVIGIGAEGGAERGFAPGFAPRVAAIAELGYDFWSARMGLSYADSGPVAEEAGRARYRMYGVRAMFSPLRLQLTDGFLLAIGGGFDAGLVHAAGERSIRIVHPASTTKAWFSPALGGRFELSPDPALAFHVEALAGFPVTRHEFELDRDLVHEVPSVTASCAVGLIVRFE